MPISTLNFIPRLLLAAEFVCISFFQLPCRHYFLTFKNNICQPCTSFFVFQFSSEIVTQVNAIEMHICNARQEQWLKYNHKKVTFCIFSSICILVFKCDCKTLFKLFPRCCCRFWIKYTPKTNVLKQQKWTHPFIECIGFEMYLFILSV